MAAFETHIAAGGIRRDSSVDVAEGDAAAGSLAVNLPLKIADADIAAGCFELRVVTRWNGDDEFRFVIAPVEKSRFLIELPANDDVVALLLDRDIQIAV